MLNIKKRAFVISLCCLIVLSLISLIGAQVPSEFDSENLQNDSIVQGVQKIQQFSEGDHIDFLGQQWRGLLLKNAFISKIDNFFKKINVLFVIIFARDYSFSLELFIAAILWLITLFALPKYLLFVKNKGIRFAISLALVIGLSHTQLFNSISKLLFKIIFYKVEWWWKVLGYLAILIALFVYYFLNRYLAQIVKQSEEKKRKQKAEINEAKIEGVVEGMEDEIRS